MNANERELNHKDEVFEVAGCAVGVLNELGHGLLETPYDTIRVHSRSFAVLSRVNGYGESRTAEASRDV